MSRQPSPVDAYPATIVVAIACVTLAVVTRMFGPPEEFQELLLQHGLLSPALVADGDWWRLLAAAFLHGGAVHLVFNLMMLWSLGPALEQSLGSLRFTALYVASSVFGNVAVCLLYDPRQPVLGASGAIFGLMGAAVALNMRSGRHAFAFLDFEGPRRLLGTIAINLVIGFLLPFVSNTAHVGGLLADRAATRAVRLPCARPRAAGVERRSGDARRLAGEGLQPRARPGAGSATAGSAARRRRAPSAAAAPALSARAARPPATRTPTARRGWRRRAGARCTRPCRAGTARRTGPGPCRCRSALRAPGARSCRT